jgi:pyridoxine 5-phosphate synthase
VAALPGFEEFNIGYSIIARAIFTGLREAVREMKSLLLRFSPSAAEEINS